MVTCLCPINMLQKKKKNIFIYWHLKNNNCKKTKCADTDKKVHYNIAPWNL